MSYDYDNYADGGYGYEDPGYGYDDYGVDAAYDAGVGYEDPIYGLVSGALVGGYLMADLPLSLQDSYAVGSDPYLYDDDRFVDDFVDDWGGVGGDLLYDRMDYWVDDVPLADVWIGDNWGGDQLAFADLLAFQRELEMDRSLDEAQRLNYFEERLLFEELDERERMRRGIGIDGR